jgi:nucleoside-diphosphate-sugar epimerase
VGSRLTSRLALDFDRVDILDRNMPMYAAPGDVHVGDARELLPQLERYDVVLQLAADIGGRAGIENHRVRTAGNLATDAAFFEYAIRTRPARAGYLSSSAVYGGPSTGECREDQVDPAADDVIRPDGLYGWIKLAGEDQAQELHRQHGIATVRYRPFTIYGPGQGLDYPIPAILDRAARALDPLTVWGSGQQVRDFIHIDDAVEIIARSIMAAPPGMAINVSTGVPTSFLAVAQMAADLCGYAPIVSGLSATVGGVPHRVGSTERLLRWHRPSIDLRTGLQRLLGERIDHS